MPSAPATEASEQATVDLRPSAVAELRSHLELVRAAVPPPKRPKSALPKVLGITVLAAALGGGLGWLAMTRLGQPAPSCDAPLPVVRGGGKLWIALELPPGVALKLVSGGAQRVPAGIAMVVENAEGRSRLLAEDVDKLPADLFACPIAR